MSERENIENGLKRVARITKKILKNPIMRKVILVVAIFATIVILLGSAYDSLVDAFQNNVSEHVKNNPIKYDYSTGDKSIQISDETVENLTKVIEDMGIKIDDLKLSKDDISKLYAAELVSSEVNRINEADGEREENGKYYGRVYIKRLNPDTGKLEALKFEPSLTTFEQMDASEIVNYFSMDGDKICIASIQPSTDADGNITNSITIDKLSYKDDILQYTVPIEFLLDLCFISQNPGFVLALADKIINETEIVIQVLQDTTTTQTDTTYTYCTETENSTRYDKYDKDGKLISSSTDTPDPTVSDPVSETTTQTQTWVKSKIKVKSVKNWIMEVEKNYNKVSSTVITPADGEVAELETLEDEVKKSHQYTYSKKQTHSDKSFTLVYTSSITRKVNQTELNKITTTAETYQNGTSEGVKDKVDEFIEMLKTPYSVPGSFSKKAAIDKLENGAEMFFNMLQNGERTQTLEQLMRYILGKATKNNYGVSEFDFGVFDIKDFTTISEIYGSTVEDKVWYTLKKLGYSNESIAGAMGNIKRESAFDPTALNSSSGAYGLAQWLGGRRTSLQNYAASKGKTEDDVDTQIEFLVAEITGQGDAVGFATRRLSGGKGENYHTYDEWENATTVEDAAVAYCWFYETPSTSSTRTPETIESENKRIEAAQEYYELYKDRGNGGEYTAISDDYGVKGYYTASNGRTFTVLNQSSISGWSDKCNRAACAIIASGYSNESSTELISSINSASLNLYGAIPGQGSSYWSKYGLDVTSYESNPSDYESKLEKQLISGGYALLWLNNNSSAYFGKSGINWTKVYHWIAIIDYRNTSGADEICVADWRGITWVGIDEFETHGITHMVFVNEK